MRRPIKTEWTATFLTLVGASLLALNIPASPWAYPIMLAGAVLWVATAVKTRDLPLALLNCGFLLINSVGIWRWLL